MLCEDRPSPVAMTAPIPSHASPALRDALVASTHVALIKNTGYLMFNGLEEEKHGHVR